MSDGCPIRRLGFSFASASMPPIASMRPFAMREGKKPGAMALHMMWRGPSSTARWWMRWMTAAFEAVYEGTLCSPVLPMPMPATEAVAMTRDGFSTVARFWRRGANLCQAY